MDSLDDYFEYAMDLAEPQRAELIKSLKKDQPDMAVRLAQALSSMVKNPDFLCQSQPASRAANEPDVVHHVTVQVGDLERAIKWYGETFRAKLVRRSSDRAVFAFESLELHLAGPDTEPAGITIVRHDVAKMGPSKRRANGVRGLHLVDPWGNAIEVVDRASD
ncbi:MAG: catechol-2,3-dioxygenase [Hyphomicrobiaceae bacterium]|jgi:predicted enzyme related to lactoylglutathione lyase